MSSAIPLSVVGRRFRRWIDLPNSPLGRGRSDYYAAYRFLRTHVRAVRHFDSPVPGGSGDEAWMAGERQLKTLPIASQR
jgi:hypothetical protein